MNIFKPNGFLKVGGVILLILGILGYLLPDGKLIGDYLWFDKWENITHTVLGIVAIVLAYVLPEKGAKAITVLVGLAALFFGVMGFIVSGSQEPLNFYGLTNLENPADNILHLAVGLWALIAGFSKNSAPAPMQQV